MRIAAIADIHGNIDALEAVLADIETRRVDRIVNLGDVLSGPLFPVECAERLMPMNLPTVRGNHERQLLTVPQEKMGPSDRYTDSCIGDKHRAWIATFPETLVFENMLLVHGTAASDTEYFLETVDEGGLRPATVEEIERRSTAARVTVCGHTHLARVACLDDGRMIVNPGSVGLPGYDDERPYPHKVESGSPHARYAIVENGSVELIAVEYDFSRAAEAAEARKRPEWASALRTGRLR